MEKEEPLPTFFVGNRYLVKEPRQEEPASAARYSRQNGYFQVLFWHFQTRYDNVLISFCYDVFLKGFYPDLPVEFFIFYHGKCKERAVFENKMNLDKRKIIDSIK